jgi:DNA-binding IclR family transcriptional regulator
MKGKAVPVTGRGDPAKDKLKRTTMDVNRVFVVKEFSWIIVDSMESPRRARRVLAGIGNRYPLLRFGGTRALACFCSHFMPSASKSLPPNINKSEDR